MSTAAPAPSRQDIEAKIVKRCWENDAFRKEFVADPAGCFVKYLNVPKAQLPKIVLHQEEAGSWHIVLPAKPAKTGELSDAELEKVAGGTDVIATIAISLGVVSGAATFAAYGAGVNQGW
ncbi:MAG TPA: NHLP leader peptide family RiPP precursor [Stellaceae bacterium]|nr:NHLP leader peptide family RiPP precursor [Stellaceae bacterium]